MDRGITTFTFFFLERQGKDRQTLRVDLIHSLICEDSCSYQVKKKTTTTTKQKTNEIDVNV